MNILKQSIFQAMQFFYNIKHHKYETFNIIFILILIFYIIIIHIKIKIFKYILMYVFNARFFYTTSQKNFK